MKHRSISPKSIAKWFINRVDRAAGDDITHLKLQKLVYYTQAWWLANKNESLFDEDMQAWTHGPVTPSLWKEYKDGGWESLRPIEQVITLPKDITIFLALIYDLYGKFSAKQLEKKTHEEDPWVVTRHGLPLEAKCTDPIDKKLMRDYYGNRIGKQWST